MNRERICKESTEQTIKNKICHRVIVFMAIIDLD